MRVLLPVALLCALALAACERKTPVAAHGSQERVRQLGFEPLLDPDKHREAWAELSRIRLQSIDIAADGKAALLVASQPFYWDAAAPASGSQAAGAQGSGFSAQPTQAGYRWSHPSEADTLWLDLGETVTPHSLLLGPGRHSVEADFAARTVSYSVPDPSGALNYFTTNVDDRNQSALRTPPQALTPRFPPGWTPPEGRTARSFPDLGDSGAQWVWLEPVAGHASGTGRAEAAAQPGEVLLFLDRQAEPAARMLTGSLPFDALAGDAAQHRAFLVLDGAGVVLADFSRGAAAEPRWLLRDSGSRLLLAARAGKLVVQGAGTLNAISLDELAELAPRLLASVQLGRTEARRLKPALEALGWDWKRVQLSPLVHRTGRLTFLDSGDLESTTAELVWSAGSGRALRLVLTRRPRDLDDELRGLSAAEREQRLRGLLTLLGWPQAQRQEDAGATDGTDGEVREEWALVPDAQSPRDPGGFSLWLTEEAAVWELHGATDELPRGTLSVEEARAKAEAHLSGKTQYSPPLSQQGDAFFALQPRTGWLGLPGSDQSMHDGRGTAELMESEPFDNSAPYYQFDFVQFAAGRPLQVQTVQVQAYGGEAWNFGGNGTATEARRRILRGDFGEEAKARLANGESLVPAPREPSPQ